MRVLRVYHAGRDSAHRARDRALVRAGVDVILVVPDAWPGPDDVHPEPFEILPLPVRRPGDVNRHRFGDARALARVVERVRPDLVDLHEEPFSFVVHQLLDVLAGVPVVAYSAQNIDKRWPPPFAQWERHALARLDGLYPCSRQAASVVRGKGFAGPVAVLPLGVDANVFAAGSAARERVVGLVGRLVPEKGVLDAVRVAAATRARLVVVGEGPEQPAAAALARKLDIDVDFHPWTDAAGLAELYRSMRVVLVPSRATDTWAEQFGRVVVEARACGAAVAGYASGALPEVVGTDGRLVPEGDVAGLVRATSELLDGPPGGGLAAQDWDAVATGQLALYERALRGEAPAATGRDAAVPEFGPTAILPAGARPFALPVLRKDSAASRRLAGVLDRLG